jgi:lysophospholipase L1-like esterase
VRAAAPPPPAPALPPLVPPVDGRVSLTPVASDWWDNGYVGPQGTDYVRTSAYARYVVKTDAASVTLQMFSDDFDFAAPTEPAISSIGLRIVVDGKTTEILIEATQTGISSVTQDLPAGAKTIEIVQGAQTIPGVPNVEGTSLISAEFNGCTYAAPQPAQGSNRLTIYGDSICMGDQTDQPPFQAWPVLLRRTYPGSVQLEAWGFRSLWEDASGGSTALTSSIIVNRPRRLYIAIGTNDYGLSLWSAGQFGVAYGGLLNAVHAALPGTTIYCQTPLARQEEGANAAGATMADYRSQIEIACLSRHWARLVRGPDLVTLGILPDGLHPLTADHVKIAAAVSKVLV